jgi:hypothetical protein
MYINRRNFVITVAIMLILLYVMTRPVKPRGITIDIQGHPVPTQTRNR